jgi:hypothetical protein
MTPAETDWIPIRPGPLDGDGYAHALVQPAARRPGPPPLPFPGATAGTPEHAHPLSPAAVPPSTQPDDLCSNCRAHPATVCRECVRALALMWFGAIARYPEHGIDCLICEQGRPEYCGECFVAEVSEYRALLRAGGHRIAGEPAWGAGAAHQRLGGIQRAEGELP